MRTATMLFTIGFPLLLSSAAFAQDEGDDAGQTAFNNACRTCHTVDPGDNRLGPSLHGVVGRKSGQVEGYNYSSALADGAYTWDKETLNRFIEDPQAVAPGNNMKPFTGISDPKTREVIVAYLAAQSGGGEGAAQEGADAKKTGSEADRQQ